MNDGITHSVSEVILRDTFPLRTFVIWVESCSGILASMVSDSIFYIALGRAILIHASSKP
jgi:hypothetical protein